MYIYKINILYKYIMSAGTVDTTFNTPDGYIIKQYTAGKNTLGNSVAIDSVGRIIVTGETIDINDTSNMFITRYLSDGNLDTSFASGGVVIKQYLVGGTNGKSVAIDSFDRIIVIGDTGNGRMFITRFLTNGDLDTSFAGTGVVFNNYSSDGTNGNSVAIDSFDRIVVTGSLRNTDNIISMFITRYMSDGKLDTSFDDGVIIKQYTIGKSTNGLSLAIDSFDRIVVTGYTFDINDIANMFITRYLSDGNLDTSFASSGVIIKQYSNNNTGGNSLAIDSFDRIVVIGFTGDITNTENMFITRYLSDGNLDTSFSGGVIFNKYRLLNTSGNSVSIDSLGRIVITGLIYDNNYVENMFITRYFSDGNLDTSFADGVVFKQYTSGKSTNGLSLTIDSSDRIVITGYTFDNTDISNMFLTRYLGNITEPICLPAGTPIVTDQCVIAIDKIDTKVHTINNIRIIAITKTITPEKNLVCFEANSMAINCPSKRTIMTPGHEVLYKGKLVQAKHFVGRLDGVHMIPYNGKDVLYNVLQEKHGLMYVNNMVLETLHPENKVAKEILKNLQ
jgi:uncharacterized delta-60 repeat protein